MGGPIERAIPHTNGLPTNTENRIFMGGGAGLLIKVEDSVYLCWRHLPEITCCLLYLRFSFSLDLMTLYIHTRQSTSFRPTATRACQHYAAYVAGYSYLSYFGDMDS